MTPSSSIFTAEAEISDSDLEGVVGGAGIPSTNKIKNEATDVIAHVMALPSHATPLQSVQP